MQLTIAAETLADAEDYNNHIYERETLVNYFETYLWFMIELT